MDHANGTGTWHYGLIARWWADTNEATAAEIDYFAAAIRRSGEPALDIGCGTGRLLRPLLELGLDVDGTDISADMLEHARTAAHGLGREPALTASPTHELELERRYRTIFMSGVFGIGATREQDMEGLRRLHDLLEPGGALLIEHWLPYADKDMHGWARWLADHRADLPGEWPAEGQRRTLRDGDELVLASRLVSFDPMEQRHVLEMRARLWRAGGIVREEVGRLSENLYFAQELRLVLEVAGFVDVVIEGPLTGEPALPDDERIVLVARRE